MWNSGAGNLVYGSRHQSQCWKSPRRDRGLFPGWGSRLCLACGVGYMVSQWLFPLRSEGHPHPGKCSSSGLYPRPLGFSPTATTSFYLNLQFSSSSSPHTALHFPSATPQHDSPWDFPQWKAIVSWKRSWTKSAMCPAPCGPGLMVNSTRCRAVRDPTLPSQRTRSPSPNKWGNLNPLPLWGEPGTLNSNLPSKYS